jgi:hypothetical protein
MILAMDEGTSSQFSRAFLVQWNGSPTGPQPPLVDPAVHLGALGLELLDPRLHVGQLALELLDLLRVRPHGLVEGGGEQVGHRLGLERRAVHRLGHRRAHGHAAVAHAADGHALLLRLLLARVHVCCVVGIGSSLDRLVVAAALGALLAEVVEALAVAVVLYVAVGAG